MTTPTHSHKAWTDKGGHVMLAGEGCFASSRDQALKNQP